MGGRLYISDKTAATFGGRERVEEIFQRIGSNGHVVVFGENDSPQEVEALFWQAKRGSVGFFTWLNQSDMNTIVEKANSVPIPALMSFDINGDKRFDIYSFKDTEQLFTGELQILPGDRATVREFLFAHEIGHAEGSIPNTFWDRWRSETKSDQDGFRGLGSRATPQFQEGILAARAGNALGDMIALQEMKLDHRSIYSQLVRNPEFIHSTVLGTFLPGEQRFEVTQQSLNTSLDSFREAVLGRLYDNQMARTPDFKLDISSISTSDVDSYYEDSFRNMIGKQSEAVAARYEPFITNLNDLNDRQDRLWQQYHALGEGNQAQKDILYQQIVGLKEQMKVELQQGLDFMRETNPELYRQLIVSEYFGLFNRQAGMIDMELGEKSPQQFIAGLQKSMLDVVLQLRSEGAFANDPIQKRLTDYMARDAQLRPEFYGMASQPSLTEPRQLTPSAGTPARP